jgi:hypothetical protein
MDTLLAARHGVAVKEEISLFGCCSYCADEVFGCQGDNLQSCAKLVDAGKSKITKNGKFLCQVEEFGRMYYY